MIFHRRGKSCATSWFDLMPTSIALCCLLKILDLQFHLTQTGKAMDIFKLTAFDLMLARPDLPNRLFSNPSCTSDLFFREGAGTNPIRINDLSQAQLTHCALFPEEPIHLPQTRQRWRRVLEQTVPAFYSSWDSAGTSPMSCIMINLMRTSIAKCRSLKNPNL